MAIWHGLVDALANILAFFHDQLDGPFGVHSWGWAIIVLTITVRLVLLPLAIKQIRSQRAMQSLQPEMKKIQAKYKADRGLMKTDPEKYKDLRQKQQAAMMELYKEHGVNPASGCLPLVAQMPIFFALFSILRPERGLIEQSPFYLLTDITQTVRAAGPSAWFLLFLMAATTYYSSKQMMAATPSSGQQAQQQKIMMYAMPVMLTVFAFSMNIGVLIYWITTNVWTIGQQFVMFRAAGSSPALDEAKSAATTAAATKPGKATPTRSVTTKATAAKAKTAKATKGATAATAKSPKAKNKPANETGK